MSSIASRAISDPNSVPVPVSTYALFDANAVTLATFLGTPVIGGGLMALNYRRLGQTGRAATTLLVTIAVTALAILIGWNIPQGGSFPVALGLVFLMKFSAQRLQGAQVKRHVEQGGKLGSKGLSAGLGLAFSIALFAAIFEIVSLQEKAETGPSIHMGSKDEVYYAGSATKGQAQAVGNALKESGYFSDKGADVFLAKNADGTSLSFIVKPDSWNDPATIAAFEVIGQQTAPSAGGFPIQLRLMDKERQVKAQSTVGRANVGNDHVYYFGTATEDEAQKLGVALKTNGFFQGKGVDVFLTKHNDRATLSFVVSDGVWNDAATVSEFAGLVRKVAPSVGGLPLRLRLLNTTLETKKEQAVS